MNRKAILISIIALTTILLTSSIIVLSQAQQPTENDPEYIGYSLTQVRVPGPASVDTSGAPELIIIESNETMTQGNITIGNQTYTYPEDFDYNGKVHIELNAISGDSFARVEKTFTFKAANESTLNSWLVIHITGLSVDTTTGQINAANMTSEGTFKLTGTGTFSQVDGFGIENNGYHFGFIKGWPL